MFSFQIQVQLMVFPIVLAKKGIITVIQMIYLIEAMQ